MAAGAGDPDVERAQAIVLAARQAEQAITLGEGVQLGRGEARDGAFGGIVGAEQAGVGGRCLAGGARAQQGGGEDGATDPAHGRAN